MKHIKVTLVTSHTSGSKSSLTIIISSISSSGNSIITVIIDIINRCAFSIFSDFTSMFAEADKNNDGYIDFDEFVLMMLPSTGAAANKIL